MTAEKLSAQLVSLIARIAGHLRLSDGSALLAQARAAAIVQEVPGRSIDVIVPRSVERIALADGPINPIPAVIVGGELVGEFIVWVRDGALTGVEQPWFGEEPPNTWPEVTSLDFE